jgi:hypothetical protein
MRSVWILSDFSFSKMLSQTSSDATEALELQLNTYKKVLELTADVGTMSLLASETSKFYKQVEDILHLIDASNETAGVLRNVADRLEVAATHSQGNSLDQTE